MHPLLFIKGGVEVQNRVSNLFNFKDVVNTKLSSHIVYKFMCSCCNATYHGQTQRYFLRELLSICLLHLRLGNLLKRSRNLLFFCLDGHKASFDNFSILLKESNAYKLQLTESLLILREKPILNKNIYLFLLKLFDWL